MHAGYEYILAGLVLLLILSVAEMNIFAVMTQQLTKMEQETEYPTAGRILDMILLSPGYPPNWGNESVEPTSLGLALQNALRAYVLDISKVIKLVPRYSNSSISPGKARQLMGLSEDYHFNLTIVPVFNIDIANVSSPGERKFIITVRDFKGFRIANVNVTGFYVPNSLTGVKLYPSKSAITGLNGSCTFTFDPLPDHFFVVFASQLEVKAIRTDPPDPENLKVRVEAGYVMKSAFPVIQAVNCATGSVFALSSESVSTYAEIDGMTYYVKFDLWR